MSSWMFAAGVTLTACSSLLGIDEPVPSSQGGMGASGGAEVSNGGSGSHGGDGPVGGTGDGGGGAPLGGTSESGGVGGSADSGGTGTSGAGNPEGGAGAGSAGAPLTGGNTGAGGSPDESGGAHATGGSESGSANGGVGGAGGDASGDSWAGEPGTDPGPVLGGVCDTEGLHACAAYDPSLRLKCRARRWAIEEVCASARVCDPETNSCIDYNGDCLGRMGVVECTAWGELWDCSDPLHPVWQMCPYGCEGSSCLPGGGEELIVHTKDIITQGRYSSPWPRRIPLCFLSNAPDLNWRAVLRDEVERSWERYLDVDFYGWDDCVGDDDPGVRVTIRRKCRLTLGTEPAWGFLGPQTPSQVDVCLDYYDAGGVRRHTSEALLRFLARHQFGHVLGLKDSASAPSVMTRALELSQSADLVITEDDLDELVRIGYARKHAGAVVAAASGLCITSNEGGVALASCIDPSDSKLATSGQVFAVNSQRIELAGAGCLVEPDQTSEAPSVATCVAGAPEAFKLEPAAWRRQDRCVVPIRPDLEGALLGLERCDPRDPTWRVWRFEPTTPGHVTVEYSDAGYCVTGQDLGKPLELQPCSGRAEQQFQPGSQVLFANSDWCVAFGNDLLYTTSCGNSFDIVRWLVTGTLASDAFRLRAAPQSDALELVPLGNDVAEAELFDVHF